MHKNDIIEYRLLVEKAYEYHKWLMEMPPLHFKENWKVTIVPPFHGAIVRFYVDYKDKHVSCYLDCYDELGYYGEPYWEIYPYTYEDDTVDVWRCPFKNTDELIAKITEELENK